MRFSLRDRLVPSDVGSRVTVRAKISPQGFRDTVGVLESVTDDAFQVRNKRGEVIRIDRIDVVASKVISS